MFTFGIFTTHIPYLAFVVFYAYFFLFGVNKASNSEIQLVENQHKIEIYAGNHFSGSVNHAFQFGKTTTVEFQNSIVKISLFKQKTAYPVFRKPEYKLKFLSPSLFSRPPPAA